MIKSRVSGYLELQLSDVLTYADFTPREPFKINITTNPAENELFITYRDYKISNRKYAKSGFQIESESCQIRQTHKIQFGNLLSFCVSKQMSMKFIWAQKSYPGLLVSY